MNVSVHSVVYGAGGTSCWRWVKVKLRLPSKSWYGTWLEGKLNPNKPDLYPQTLYQDSYHLCISSQPFMYSYPQEAHQYHPDFSSYGKIFEGKSFIKNQTKMTRYILVQ